MAKAKVSQNNSTKKKKKIVPQINMKQMIEKSARAFEEAVAKLKEDHPGNMIQVNLLTDTLVMRAVAAWPNVPREIHVHAYEKTDPWEMFWFAPGAWMEAARVPRDQEKGVMHVIRQNHLVYPDGTSPEHVRLYLIENGRLLLGLPTQGLKHDPDEKEDEDSPPNYPK